MHLVLYSTVYHLSFNSKEKQVEHYSLYDFHGSGMTSDYIVKLVLLRWEIRASVFALAVWGDECDGHISVLMSMFISETGVHNVNLGKHGFSLSVCVGTR